MGERTSRAGSSDLLSGVRQLAVERETDLLLQRKLERRESEGPFVRPSLDQILVSARAMLDDVLGPGVYEIDEPAWFTGGVSKIQVGFRLLRPSLPPRRLVVRMDPGESTNATSRRRESQVISAVAGTVPVPEVFVLDQDARWFAEPALVYDFVSGVSKPSLGRANVSGVGTDFGELRGELGDQFLDNLVKIHTFDYSTHDLSSMDVPRTGTADAAEWQLGRSFRVWREDRLTSDPLMEITARWLEENMPACDHVSLVHGDYRSGNFLFDESTRRVTAVLDWERSHLGDRHRDLSWTMNEVFGHYGGSGEYLVCGLVERAEFLSRYEALSGLTVDRERLRYYSVLNCFQLLVSLHASAYRIVRLGKSHQDVVLAYVKGQGAAVSRELVRLLREGWE